MASVTYSYSVASGRGRVTESVDGDYAVLEAVPEGGWKISKWEVDYSYQIYDGAPVSSDTMTYSSATKSIRISTVAVFYMEDYKIRVYFEPRSGELLCTGAGRMLCNSSGQLLYAG